ncbi:MAG TPA: hypothetical protein VFX76_19925 [Roseiflexaceae bacterium]|nr:hypothetical protein [Roseiflexaceae bacterium]
MPSAFDLPYFRCYSNYARWPEQVPPLQRGVLQGAAVPTLRGLSENLYISDEPYIVDQSAYAQAFGEHATSLRESIRCCSTH